MKKYDKVKDSGKRQEFSTGSKRDTSEGKGMPHLIAGEVFNLIERYIPLTSKKKVNGHLLAIQWELRQYSTLVDDREYNIISIYNSVRHIIAYISEIEDGAYSSAMKRLAIHYANGAKKYDKNNWRKGQPISRYCDSAMRHLWACIDGKDDEDHASALFWNLVGIVQTKIDIEKGLLPEELNDYPFTIEETLGNVKKGKTNNGKRR